MSGLRQWLRQRGRTRPSPEGLAVFFRSLGLCQSGGIPLHKGLRMLGHQQAGAVPKAVATAMGRVLENGGALSRAMAEQPRVFRPLHVRMVEVGEGTGRLEEVLRHLAAMEERRGALLARLRSRLVQPALVFLVLLALMVLVPPLLFQDLLQLLGEEGSLPLATRAVVDLSRIVVSPWTWAAVGFLAWWCATAGRKWLTGDERGRRVAARVLGGLPVLGPVLRLQAEARFAAALAPGLESGLDVREAVRLAAAATDWRPLREAAADVVIRLEAGETLARALRATGVFPEPFLHPVRAGEESGRLPEMLGWLARFLERELDSRLQTLSELAEPLVLAILGAAAGAFALAVMQPLLQVVDRL